MTKEERIREEAQDEVCAKIRELMRAYEGKAEEAFMEHYDEDNDEVQSAMAYTRGHVYTRVYNDLDKLLETV